ncbi:CapA family protein [Citricoccus sp. CH26A]|uniref:CapA family protein n=1 Tax=Citricoccus TaxID=169133 RepID=UPI0009FBC772|nr:CapA family protein [Citricoccus sp. CH26A]
MKVFVGGDVANASQASGKIIGAGLENVVQAADVSILNLEGPIDGAGHKEPKVGRHIHNYRATVRGLHEQGVDLFLLANNHIMDFGSPGLEATIAEIEKSGARYMGAGPHASRTAPTLILSVGEIKLGLLNVCEAQFGATCSNEANARAGYAWINDPLIESWMHELREQADFVIVLPHAGLENVPIPQRYWRDTYRWFCDIGADAVVGAHPHVAQGFERYRNAVIFYSVGNFYFDNAQGLGDPESGFSVLLDFEPGRPIEFELVHHRRSGNLVEVAPESDHVDVESLCRMLGAEYAQIHDHVTREKFPLLRRMLLTGVGHFPNDPDIGRSLRRRIKGLLRRPVDRRDMLLLHALRNETWRKLGEEYAKLEARTYRE